MKYLILVYVFLVCSNTWAGSCPSPLGACSDPEYEYIACCYYKKEFAKSWLCRANWHTCQEWGKIEERFDKIEPKFICDTLYKKAAADLITNIECIDSSGYQVNLVTQNCPTN